MNYCQNKVQEEKTKKHFLKSKIKKKQLLYLQRFKQINKQYQIVTLFKKLW